ncbi:ice-binding family protein [Streptomyces antibioticus]|uniref:ice-binding family protein n=1 Tax=Streptomyces antibioticus TaxID=1890 RepID=UPI0037BCEDF8
MKLKLPKFPQPGGGRRTVSGVLGSALAATVATVMVAVTPTPASAIALPVPLGTTASYSVLAGQGVTNVGPTVLDHDLGSHPNGAFTGFPPGLVLGAVHPADAAAAQAKSDLVVAYNNAAGQLEGQAPDFPLAAGIGGGQELLAGVHRATSGVGLTGDLILNAGGNPNAVWVFQIPEALTTAVSSRILFTNGASPCNVFWQIGSSATIGGSSTFVGTIMALTSIFVGSGATIEGRALARNGEVTLNNNRIFLNGCATSTTGGTTTGTTAGTTTGTTTGTTAGTTTSGGLLSGGLLSGGLVSGGLLGGPIVGTGGTSGNVAGNTSGNTAGNTAGNTTSGNTAGNTAGNATLGNTSGGNGGGHDHAPGRPAHGVKPGKPGKPHHGGKPDLGPHIHPGKHDQGKPDHGKQPDKDYGYGDLPKGYGGDSHAKGHNG